MKYLIKMQNPLSGKLEIYSTQASSRKDLQLGLDFLEKDAGYKILKVQEITE